MTDKKSSPCLHRGVDPMVDVIFKKIFAREETKNLLLSFINATLEHYNETKLKEIELLNPFNLQEYLTDKLSIVDIKGKDEKGEIIIIEIQINMVSYYPKRLLYYWSRQYIGQLQQGEEYDKLQKVRLITVNKTKLPIDTSSFIHRFIVVDPDYNLRFCEDFEIYSIDLKLFPKQAEEIQDSLERWAYFFKYGKYIKKDELPPTLRTPEIEKALEELEVVSMDEKEWQLYESRRIALMDQASMIKGSYATGKKEGIQIGKKEGMLQGIRLALEVKYGSEGLDAMKGLENIQSIEELAQVEKLIKQCKSIEEFIDELGKLRKTRKTH